MLKNLWNGNQAIKVIEKSPVAITPIKNKIFGGTGIIVNSYTLSKNVIRKSLKHLPMVLNSTEAEPMGDAIMNALNTHIGSMFAVDEVDYQIQTEWEQLTGMAFEREMQYFADNGVLHKDTYIENMLASTLTGTTTMKYRLRGGGWDTYTIPFGTVSTTTVTGDWVNADVAGIYSDLRAMNDEVDTQMGYKVPKNELPTLASRTAFAAALKAVKAKQAIDVIPTKVGTEDGFDYIDIWGYRIWDIDGSYVDAETQSPAQAVAEDDVQMVHSGMMSANRFYYVKLENSKAGRRALPLFMYPVENDNGKETKIYYESKPVPVFNISGTTKATVVV